MRFYGIFLICIFVSGCAALLTEQSYVRIEAPVTKEYFFDAAGRRYPVYTLPEKQDIRKIRILGEGKMINTKIYVARESKAFSMWKIVKRINNRTDFPIDIMLSAYTDSVRISGKVQGYIYTVEFYTLVSKDQ